MTAKKNSFAMVEENFNSENLEQRKKSFEHLIIKILKDINWGEKYFHGEDLHE